MKGCEDHCEERKQEPCDEESEQGCWAWGGGWRSYLVGVIRLSLPRLTVAMVMPWLRPGVPSGRSERVFV